MASISNVIIDLLLATAELTSPEVKNLHVTPIEVIPAPGTGKKICVVNGSSHLNYGSDVFVTSTYLGLRYGTNSILAIANISSPRMIISNQNCFSGQQPSIPLGAVVNSQLDNQAVYLFNSGSEITGNASNDSTLTVQVAYYIIDL